ncbi:MAG: phosphatidate cytidylyltransferase [Paracoccaceae bacterium]|nr:MAG: phosphatidate cytidylyltransferase [Paracoccaceae bacterium]
MTAEDHVPPRPPRWSDLRKRVASAVVMVAVGAVEVWLGGAAFAVLVVLITGGMLWELARLTAPSRPQDAILMGAGGGAALVMTFLNDASFAAIILLVPAFAFALTRRRDRRLSAAWAAAAMVAGYGLVSIREGSGTAALLWLILVVVASDVLGYFVGRMMGGPKFWPAISPKKTWSGTVAGWIGAAGVGAGFVAAGLAGPAGWLLVPVSPLVAVAGQMADIGESWIKRRAGVKDSSNLIPGHGGLMDRFDALTGAVVAVMLLGLVANLPLPAPHPFGLPFGGP